MRGAVDMKVLLFLAQGFETMEASAEEYERRKEIYENIDY